MGLGGISVWQLILVLLIAVFALLAVGLPHHADTREIKDTEPAASADPVAADDSDEEPPLGVG